MLTNANSRLFGWSGATALYAAIAVLALAGVLRAPGTLGHHWDWLIPSDPAELRRFAATSGYAWQDFDFGSYVTFHYSTTLTNVLFGMLGFAGIDGAFVTKSLLLLSVLGSGVGMRFLLLSLTPVPGERDGIYATFGGLLYALAPFNYNQIIAGDQSALIGDALSPIAIGLAVRAVYADGRIWLAYALGASLLLAIIVASAQVFAFTLGIAWVVALVLRGSARSAVRLATLTVAGIATSAFWILPAFLAGDSVRTVVQTAAVDRAFATFAQFSNPLFTLTTIAFPGDFYFHALGWGAPAFFAAYAALLGLCVVALVTRPSPLLAVLCAVFAVTAFLPLGGNSAFGPAILAIFKALLPYSLFLRTPQHLMFVPTIVVPIMVYLSARGVAARLFTRTLVAGAFVVAAYGFGFFAHSGFFGLIGPFRETAGERATVAAASTSGEEPYRTLYVPTSESYYYHPGVFDYHFEGGDEPQIRFLPAMSIGAGAKWTPYDGTQQLLMALDELVPDGSDARTQTLLLQIAGVKRIVVHAIGAPGSGVRMTHNNARPYLEAAMKRANVATIDGTFDDRSIWRFDRPVPRVYAPDCVFGVPPAVDVYDLLALAPAASTCARPAFVATSPAQRSEVVIPAVAFAQNASPGAALGLPRANVAVTGDGSRFSTVVPAGIQDVESLRLPPVPRAATGIAFRMSTTPSRRIWVRLYAPDARNYFQTNVDFSGRVQDVALNFQRFERIGRPRVTRIRTLRFASRNAQLRDGSLTFGAFHWINGPAHSTPTLYLAIARNLWDQYYFGGDRERVLFQALPGRPAVYADGRIIHPGTYDVLAHVQQGAQALSLQVSVDGRWAPCSPAHLQGDVTERLVRLTRVPLRAGPHILALRYCRIPPPSPAQDVGVLSIVIARVLLAPPAVRLTGSVRVLEQRAGELRLTTDARAVVFSDSYDSRWSAAQNGKPLSHVVANGYANAWLVPHPDEGDVVLSFEPQRPLSWGIGVTIGLAAMALAVIAAMLIAARPPRRAARHIPFEARSQG